MDLDEAAAELYAADPDGFVAARTELVARARAAKDRPLATALGALKKPTRSAWLVNLLSRAPAADLGRLGVLAERLAEAHRSGDLAALRTLGAERTRLVDELCATAVAAGAEHGYPATEAVKAEVSATLAAAVADPETRAEVLAGRLVKARVYSGFGLPDMIAAGTPRTREPATDSPESAHDERERVGDEARQRAQAEVHRADERVRQARSALERASRAETDTRERLDRASQEVADLRMELRAAEAAEVTARNAATEAADELHEARALVQQAERDLAQATRALG